METKGRAGTFILSYVCGTQESIAGNDLREVSVEKPGFREGLRSVWAGFASLS